MKIFSVSLGIGILLLLIGLTGCQMKQADILVLGQKSQETKAFVVNGGPGSTEVAYEDDKGQKMSAASNVVKVPIVEKCDTKPIEGDPKLSKEKESPVKEVKEIPEEKIISPFDEKDDKKPEKFYTLDINTYPNHVVAASYEPPEISYSTEVYIRRTPPEIKLEKMTDEDKLCCDRQLTFRIKFTNLGGQDAYNVKIHDVIPARVEYVEESSGAQPYDANITIDRDKQEKATKITWNVQGPIPSGATGEVFYTVVCPPTRPKLNCYIRFDPKGLNVGQEGKVICAVNNSGTGTAEAVNVAIVIPPGIEYLGQSVGKKEVLNLGNIDAGQTAVRELKVRMRSGGKLDNIVANITTSNGEGCECIVPPAPTLKVEKSGPQLINNRLPMEYTIVVKNIGSKKAPATNCILTDQLPPFVHFKSASHNGTYDANKHCVTWNLGTLLPEAITSRTIIVIPQKAGEYVDKAQVSCDEGIIVTDTAKTVVRGITALEVSSYDTEDPVEIGGTTTYVIEILNEGFKDVTGLRIVNNIPRGSVVVNVAAKDSTGKDIGNKLSDDKTQVIFDVVPSLPSGEKVVVKITVKAMEKLQLLNSVAVSYNEFYKTIIVEEPTTTY